MWTWKDFKLILPGFVVFRLFTGQDLVEMSLKIKEETGERQELIITYNLETFQEFIISLKKINNKVEKKDFQGQALKYDFSSENKVEFSFYFNKDEFIKFYKFLEDCFREIQAQELEYKNLAKGIKQ